MGCNALISSMGNAEGEPLDASDITDLEAAKAEIVKIRESLRKRRQVTGANFPRDFRKVPSHMMRVLTQEDYERNMNLVGPRGYTFDQCIQCGIDGRGGTGVGIPDEESYYLWKGFYDKVLESRHSFPPAAVHTTDLDYTKVDTSKLPADLDDFCVSTRWVGRQGGHQQLGPHRQERGESGADHGGWRCEFDWFGETCEGWRGREGGNRGCYREIDFSERVCFLF